VERLVAEGWRRVSPGSGGRWPDGWLRCGSDLRLMTAKDDQRHDALANLCGAEEVVVEREAGTTRSAGR
jgi:hypothetical protein